MTPVRKWFIVCFVLGLCFWLVLDNLAIGSSFGRFVLSREWQNTPLTIIRLDTLFDYVETEDYLEGVHKPMSELVERHGGKVPTISAVRFEELCDSRANWQQVFVYEIDQGKEFSKIATSVKYRDLQSTNASILRASAEIAIQSNWGVQDSRTHLMLIIETRYVDQADVVTSAIAKTVEDHPGLEIVLARKAFSLTGKRNFDPDLVLIVAFDELIDLEDWNESITTQSELAILNADLDRVQAFLLNPLK